MKSQTIRRATTGTLGVVLVLALAVMVNWVAARRYQTFDWTSIGLYSLSDKTRNVLAGLEDDVDVVVFMRSIPGDDLYEKTDLLLSQYAAASEHIKLEYIDPEKDLVRTQQLAEQFNVSMANTVVFSLGDRSKYVTSDQMVDYDYGGMQMGGAPTVKAFKGEEQFTSAILSLAAPDVPRVYFVTGHGEAPLAGGGAEGRGLAVLAESLKRENIETAETSLLGGSVPEDADVLAIIGPTQPFTDNEIELLRSFLDGGGRLLVALDPTFEQDASIRSVRLEALLADYGVEVGNDLVVDPSQKLPFYDLSAVYLTELPPHAVTQGLEGVAVLFAIARSMTPLDASGAETIAETSSGGWGETNIGQLLEGEQIVADDADTPGPASVAVAVTGGAAAEAVVTETEETEEEAPEAGYRLLAFGDSDFMVDDFIINAGNFDLTMNAVNWLVERELSVGIAPQTVEELNLFLTGDQLTFILVVSLLVMPGLAIIAGIVVWRRRRH